MKVTKVVTHKDVERYTLEGWHLVHTIENASRIESHREVEQREHGSGNGAWIPEKLKITTAVVTDPLFVLEKESEVISREVELEAQLADARRLVFDQRKEADERSKLIDSIAKQLETAEKALKRSTDSLESARDREGRQSDLRLKLEADLAKIRKEVGEARWREILGK